MTEDGSDTLPDNKLFDLYEQYIGEPDAQTDVYLGFGLFFIGVALAVIAAVTFIGGVTAFGYREGSYFVFANVAFVAALLSLPLLLLGVDVLLPVEQKAVLASAAGVVVTIGATVAFSWYYPSQWAEFGATTMLTILGTYGVGLAVVAAATGAALVAHQLERAKPHPSEIEAVEEDEVEESISEEDIEQDIESAMEGVEMSWGGVEKQESKRLSFSASDSFEAANVDVEAETTRQTGGVDTQVSGLKALKGGDTKTATSSSTVDDQTSKLNELRQRKQQEEANEENDGVIADIGLIDRVRGLLGRN
jgi:hypothetical protein